MTTAMKAMSWAPVRWNTNVSKLELAERDTLRRDLEAIARRAATLAGYVDSRNGAGCGDRGHKKAVRQANSNGRKVWVGVFGYNGYHEISI